jgi:hypothetical protein
MLRLGYCWVQRYRYITIRSSHDPVVEYHWWFVLTTNSDNCWFLSLASSVRSLVVRGWSRQWKWSSVPSEQDLNNYLNARLMICWQVNIIIVSSSIGQWWSDSDCLIVCCDVVLRQGSSNSLTEELQIVVGANALWGCLADSLWMLILAKAEYSRLSLKEHGWNDSRHIATNLGGSWDTLEMDMLHADNS